MKERHFRERRQPYHEMVPYHDTDLCKIAALTHQQDMRSSAENITKVRTYHVIIKGMEKHFLGLISTTELWVSLYTLVRHGCGQS